MTHTTEATVTCTNCQLVVGMSWRWVLKFAREHDVPIWRIGRKQLVPARALFAAIEAASNAQTDKQTDAERDAARRRAFELALAAEKRKP
jgi:hypothetical protein